MAVDPETVRAAVAAIGDQAQSEAVRIAQVQAMRLVAASNRSQAQVLAMAADAIDQQADRIEDGEEEPTLGPVKIVPDVPEEREPTVEELKAELRCRLLKAVVLLATGGERAATLANVIDEAGLDPDHGDKFAPELLQDLIDQQLISTYTAGGERSFMPTELGRDRAVRL